MKYNREMRFLTPVKQVPKRFPQTQELALTPNIPLNYSQIYDTISQNKGSYVPIVFDSYQEAAYAYSNIRAHSRRHSGVHLDTLIRTYVVYVMEFDWALVKFASYTKRYGRGQIYTPVICRECSAEVEKSGPHHPTCSQYLPPVFCGFYRNRAT
jgi:hypothetical protein